MKDDSTATLTVKGPDIEEKIKCSLDFENMSFYFDAKKAKMEKSKKKEAVNDLEDSEDKEDEEVSDSMDSDDRDIETFKLQSLELSSHCALKYQISSQQTQFARLRDQGVVMAEFNSKLVAEGESYGQGFADAS